MFTAVVAALAMASAGAHDAPSANTSTVTVTDIKLSDTTTNAAMQTIQINQARPSGLDVHIRPIDPAGDLLPKLFSA
jgi:hypothetical protein